MRLVAVLLVFGAAPSLAEPALDATGQPESFVGEGLPPDWTFACDGQDTFLLAELDEAIRTRVGYGETWDESVCDHGSLSVYGDGATERWPAFRRPRLWQPTQQDQFLALAMPVVAIGGLSLCIALAAAIAAIARLKKRIVVDVPCPSCQTDIPYSLDDGSSQLFCPSCGAPCRIDVTGQGKSAAVEAVAIG